jgi:hypothetical protein
MFDFIKRMFGEGRIRFELTDENGKEWIGKAPYIGDINTMVESELKEEIARQWYVEHGTRIRDFKVLGWY